MKQHLVTLYGVFVVFFFAIPSATQATELSSTNFTLTTGGVGKSEGSILSSTNFTLIPQNNETYGGTDDEDTPPKRGSRATHIDARIGTSTLPEVIVGTYQENIVQQGGAVLYGDDESEGTYANEHDDISEVLHEVNVRADDVPDVRQMASLISAWLGEFSSDFEKIFSERTPRVIVLIFVLAWLFLIRTYTRVGRKYRPF